MKQESKNLKLQNVWIRSERGQAMAEYILLVILVSLVCIPLFKTLPDAVRGYVRPFYYCLSRPIP